MILDKSYFSSEDTPQLAYDLIGKHICRNINGKVYKYLITEVEAYHGFEDKASHARFGKTKRNEIIFGEAGFAYVYLCYGIHWLFNVVTGSVDYPAAILLRGVDQIHGPGKVTKKLAINKDFNGKLLHPQSNLWFEDLGYIPDANKILQLPRVGIDYAEEYILKPWRFYLKP